MNIFTDHPASVGESYWGHMGQAFSFGWTMLSCGVACLLHGLFPFLFVKTGSETIRALHHKMVTHRFKSGADENKANHAMDPSLLI